MYRQFLHHESFWLHMLHIINFFSNKNFYWPIRSAVFCNDFLTFWYDFLTRSPTLNLGSLLLFSAPTWFTINRFDFETYYWIYSLHRLNCQDTHFFLFFGHMLIYFVLQSSNKSFSNNRFSFVVCWLNFYIIVF